MIPSIFVLSAALLAMVPACAKTKLSLGRGPSEEPSAAGGAGGARGSDAGGEEAGTGAVDAVCGALGDGTAEVSLDYFCAELASCVDFDDRMANRDWRQLVAYLDCADGTRSLQTYDNVNFPGGYAHTYDADGELIGAIETSDVPFGACEAYEYRAGDVDFDCGSGRECFVEGVAGASGLGDPSRCVDCATGELSVELLCDLVGRLYPGGKGCPRTFSEHRSVMESYWCGSAESSAGELSFTRGCGMRWLRYETDAGLVEERAFEDSGAPSWMRSAQLGALCQNAGRSDVSAGIAPSDCDEATSCYLCKRDATAGELCDSADRD